MRAVLFLSALHTSPAHGEAEAFTLVNKRGVVGETDSLNLVEEGLILRPYYNDYAGGTDKYLTHASILGWVTRLGPFSLQPAYHWRIITPNLWDPLSEEAVASQNAPFADWRSASLTGRVKLAPEPLRYLQLEYERGKIGDFGADRAQRKMHDTIRRYTSAKIEKNEYWTPRAKGEAHVFGVEIGTGDISEAGSSKHKNLAIGLLRSPLTDDYYAIFEHLNLEEKGYEWGGNIRFVRQMPSDLYVRNLSPWRIEASLAWRFKPWLMPSIKTFSPIFTNDKKLQVYIDPINLNLSF